jgi:hypothetical protein
MPFSILFIGKSTPITDAAFTAVDPTHWVLDVISLVGAEFTNLKEVCLFLLQPNLPPDAALALYISVGEHRSRATVVTCLAPSPPPTHTSRPIVIEEHGSHNVYIPHNT